MKNLIEKALQAFQEARQRRMDGCTLAELGAHTLRDIGLHDGAERARIEVARHRPHLGLF